MSFSRSYTRLPWEVVKAHRIKQTWKKRGRHATFHVRRSVICVRDSVCYGPSGGVRLKTSYLRPRRRRIGGRSSPLILSSRRVSFYWLPVESLRTARINTRSQNKETVTSLILEINKWERRIAKSGPPSRRAARQVLFYFVLKAIYRWDCLLWVCQAWGRPVLARPLDSVTYLARHRSATSRPPIRAPEHNLKLTDTAQPPNGQQLSHSPFTERFYIFFTW